MDTGKNAKAPTRGPCASIASATGPCSGRYRDMPELGKQRKLIVVASRFCDLALGVEPVNTRELQLGPLVARWERSERPRLRAFAGEQQRHRVAAHQLVVDGGFAVWECIVPLPKEFAGSFLSRQCLSAGDVDRLAVRANDLDKRVFVVAIERVVPTADDSLLFLVGYGAPPLAGTSGWKLRRTKHCRPRIQANKGARCSRRPRG
jgi:hypothetical protein